MIKDWLIYFIIFIKNSLITREKQNKNIIIKNSNFTIKIYK